MRICTIALATLLPAAAAVAEIERQHGAHVHGEGIVNLAQDGTRFELELELPGINLVGFEHPPRDDAQRAAIADALNWLGAGQNWLRSDDSGGCAIGIVNAHTHGYDDGDTHHDHNGAEHHHDDHDHADDGAHGHHEHAEFHVRATLECAQPERLSWVELALFERFPDNNRLVVNVFTEAGQAQARLRAGSTRITLPR